MVGEGRVCGDIINVRTCYLPMDSTQHSAYSQLVPGAIAVHACTSLCILREQQSSWLFVEQSRLKSLITFTEVYVLQSIGVQALQKLSARLNAGQAATTAQIEHQQQETSALKDKQQLYARQAQKQV